MPSPVSSSVIDCRCRSWVSVRKPARREAEPDTDDEQRAGRQPDGGPVRVVQGADEEDRQAETAASSGQDEPESASARASGFERARAEPDRHRDQQDRRRPGDRVERAADVRRAERVPEEIERVTDDVQGDPAGEQDPRRLPPAPTAPPSHRRPERAAGRRRPDRRGSSPSRACCRRPTRRSCGRRTPRQTAPAPSPAITPSSQLGVDSLLTSPRMNSTTPRRPAGRTAR